MNQKRRRRCVKRRRTKPEALDALEHSDVITVVDATKALAGDMFDQVAPRPAETSRRRHKRGIGPMEGALDDMNATPHHNDGGSPHDGCSIRDDESERDSLATMIDRLPPHARESPRCSMKRRRTTSRASTSTHPISSLPYQKQLNGGFAGMFGFVAACCAVGFCPDNALPRLFRCREDRAPYATAARRSGNKPPMRRAAADARS